MAAVAAVGVMEWALITHDFSLQYVAENNARSTPLLFTITGLWAALAGSITSSSRSSPTVSNPNAASCRTSAVATPRPVAPVRTQ